jgi:hypothetical protein
MQEREETARMIQLINHKDDGHFVINMTSLHNAAQIRKILPRHLIAPRPLYMDRLARHFEIAATLRVTQAEKREATKAKAKATRDANKAKKHSRELAMEVEIDTDDEAELESGGEDSDNHGNRAHSIMHNHGKRRRV